MASGVSVFRTAVVKASSSVSGLMEELAVMAGVRPFLAAIFSFCNHTGQAFGWRPTRRASAGPGAWVRAGAVGLLLFLVGTATLGARAQTTYMVSNPSDGDANSLRQAIIDANANSTGSTNTIDFAIPGQATITLSSALPAISANVTINGPGAGQLTVSGNNANNVFTINSGVTVTISGLTVADGNSGSGGGGIFNNGVLTLTDSTVSGNTASSSGGGGIFNNGTLTLMNGTISGNTASQGGGIYDSGSGAPITLINNIITDLTYEYSTGEAMTVSTQGNVTSASLSPLGNYGGPTQTLIPLLGSPAICAGITPQAGDSWTLPQTDQRGVGRTNTTYAGYNPNSPCVDAGAVQTQYGLTFTQQPSAVGVGVTMSPPPEVQLTEAGSTRADHGFVGPSVNIPLALNGSSTPSWSAWTSTTDGIASFNSLVFSSPTSGEFTATLNVDSTLPSAIISATSNAFYVFGSSSVLALGTLPSSPLTAGGNAGTVTVQELEAREIWSSRPATASR